MRRFRLAALLILLLVSGCAGVGAGSCVLERWAEEPVDPRAGAILVAARVNRQPVRLVLDTGAQATILTLTAADRLSVGRDFAHGHVMQAAAGKTLTGVSEPLEFNFAGVGSKDMRVGVARFDLPAIDGAPPDGLLGGDFLSAIDVDFNLPAGRVGLYRARPCAGVKPPWDGPYSSVPLLQSAPSRLILPVTLNRQLMAAVLDSGATVSTVTLRGAERAGLREDQIAKGPEFKSHSASATLFTAYAHRFAEMQIGTDVFQRPPLLVGDINLGSSDVLLGLNYLRQRRVFVSYATRTIFIQNPADVRQ